MKTRDCGLNTIFENRIYFVNSFLGKFFKPMVTWSEVERYKETDTCIFIKDFTGFSAKI